MEFTLNDLLYAMAEKKASDLHVSTNSAPIIRFRGKLTRLKGFPVLDREMVINMLTTILSGVQNEKLIEEKELDFSYTLPNISRFRGNIFHERSGLGAVFRMIPQVPRPLEELGVPLIIKELSLRRHGLILVTGPSGSGKTTTLAGLVDYMNRTRNSHIITIEDPIEYVYNNRTCLVRQRELGTDTHSFSRALKSALRQDPDVILVGEMRDRETIETALTAAETGHLVISTLHTNNSIDTIVRIIDIFPGDQQAQVRVQLASSLLGVFSQTLVPHKVKERGMVIAVEVLVVTAGIRNMVREGRLHMIRHSLETGSEWGMQTMELSLKNLYDQDVITLEDAQIHSVDLQSFKELMGISAKTTQGKAPSISGSQTGITQQEPEKEIIRGDLRKHFPSASSEADDDF